MDAHYVAVMRLIITCNHAHTNSASGGRPQRGQQMQVCTYALYAGIKENKKKQTNVIEMSFGTHVFREVGTFGVNVVPKEEKKRKIGK